MVDTKITDLPVQIVSLPGSLPHAVVPLPLYLAIFVLAQRALAENGKQEQIARTADKVASIWPKVVKAESWAGPVFTSPSNSEAMKRAIVSALRGETFGEIPPGRGPSFQQLQAMIEGFEPSGEMLGNFEDNDVDAEHAADLAALAEARERDEESFPVELAERLHQGANPIKVYRRHRGFTQAALASRVGLSAMYVSQIETGRRQGSTKALRKIARALSVDLDDLTPWSQD